MIHEPAGASRSGDVTFFLDQFVDLTPGVEQAFSVSADGFLMTMHSSLAQEDADRLSAGMAGLLTLAGAASRLLAKGLLRQMTVELAEGYLMVSTFQERGCLGVVTDANCDLGTVAYETTMLAERVGPLLTPELIHEFREARSARS